MDAAEYINGIGEIEVRPRLFPDSFRPRFKEIIERDISEQEVAHIIKCSPRTVRNYLTRWRLTFTKKRPRHRGCVAVYLYNHPNTILPKSVALISHITGCTKKSVDNYLRRRRKEVILQIGATDLRKKNLILTDNNGVKTRSKWIKSYKVWLHPWDLSYLDLEAVLKDNKTYIFTIRREDLT